MTIEEEHAWAAGILGSTVTRPHERVCVYDAPAIVLGCSQRAMLDEVAVRAGSSVAVRVRPSGGGAVLVGPWMVGVSAVLPVAHPLLGRSLTDGYRWLGELFSRLLREAGIEAHTLDPAIDPLRVASGAGTAAGWACFGGLSAWEVVDAGGRKLVGLAQQRRRTGVLVTAGLLTSPPEWRLLCDAMGVPEDARHLAAGTTSCDQFRGAIGVDRREWARRIEVELRRAFATDTVRNL